MNKQRYYPYSRYLKERFGERVHKVAIDAGFTCPNRDGVKGRGGCTYCNNEGFSHNSRHELLPIAEQIERGMAFMRRRYKANRFMAYYQASSNTYGPLDYLKEVYDAVLPYPDIVAMAVGTRPDCVNEEVLDLLASYQPEREMWVEYGLQTTHNRTLQRINRSDTYERFLWAVEKAEERDLKICVHVILGLPGESHEDMMQTADRLASLPFDSLKIHLLHVMKHTLMYHQYQRGEIPLFTFDGYVKTVCDFLERIPPSVSVQRLTADAPPDVLVAPEWCLRRREIVEAIGEELERRDRWQGQLVSPCAKHDESWRTLAKRGAFTQCALPEQGAVPGGASA